MRDFLLLVKKSKKFIYQDKAFILFPFILLIIFMTLLMVNKTTKEYLGKNSLLSLPFLSQPPKPYPILKTEVAKKEFSAKTILMMDDESKIILFSKNENLRLPMASTAKIMTALVALDYYQMDDIIPIKTSNVSGVKVGFEIGESLKFKDLLYAMLLPSGNDAALALAQNYPGGETEFVKQMNKKASELHLSDTNFADPTGISESNYTTPLDLARLSSMAIKNTTFAKVVSTKHTTISDIFGTKTYSLTNLNKLLGFDSVNGIKTGFTDEAGEILVTSKTQKGHTLITVVMKSKDRFQDTKNLLRLTDGNITYLSIHP